MANRDEVLIVIPRQTVDRLLDSYEALTEAKPIQNGQVTAVFDPSWEDGVDRNRLFNDDGYRAEERKRKS